MPVCQDFVEVTSLKAKLDSSPLLVCTPRRERYPTSTKYKMLYYLIHGTPQTVVWMGGQLNRQVGDTKFLWLSFGSGKQKHLYVLYHIESIISFIHCNILHCLKRQGHALILKTTLMWGSTLDNHHNVWEGKQFASEEPVPNTFIITRGNVVCYLSMLRVQIQCHLVITDHHSFPRTENTRTLCWPL